MVETAHRSAPGIPEPVVIDDAGRPEPPLAAGEAATLLGFLEFQRATLEWKTSELDAAALAATLPHHPSPLTLGGLLGHLAWVEDHWFGYRFAGLPRAQAWDGVDWTADPDHDWHPGLDPAALRDLWWSAVARSRAVTTAALAADASPDSLDTLEARGDRHGDRVNLRWILVHLIEEYSRHNGHADLLREALDGETGE